MAAATAVLLTTLEFFDHVYENTEYENKQEAAQVFSKLRKAIPRISQTKEGYQLITKFVALSNTVTAEGLFQDMIKIIWRMVKALPGGPERKLCLFFLGVGTVVNYLMSSALKEEASIWIKGVEVWLGKQLTIGGKGCTGEGEGSVNERIQKFFSTPYLHDFD